MIMMMIKKEVELSITQPWPFQALVVWPTGIASEEDIHGAAQLLMKSIAKIRAAFTFRKKFRSKGNESTNTYSHHSKDLFLIGDNILHTGTQHTSSCWKLPQPKKQNVTKRKVRMEKFFRKRLTLFACTSEGGQRTKYFWYLKTEKETVIPEKMITGGTT